MGHLCDPRTRQLGFKLIHYRDLKLNAGELTMKWDTNDDSLKRAQDEQSAREYEVRSLVARQTEGQHWDFKREHYKAPSDLIHDVLCLANTEHKGPRYLIFGVASNGKDLHDQAVADGRGTLENITSLFADNRDKFFQSRIPDLYMFAIEVEGYCLDVLVIEDRPFKPYYLVQKYRDGKGTVYPNHIYSRKNSVNTARNATASPDEIVNMWRERFGLSMFPKERFGLYLAEDGQWDWGGDSASQDWESVRYYREAPEFTVRVRRWEGDSLPIPCSQEWTQGEISQETSCHWMDLYYHQTCLDNILVVGFDGGKKILAAPDWRFRLRSMFYFYEEGSLYHAVNMFIHNGDPQPIHLKLSKLEPDRELYDKAKDRWPTGKMVLPVVSPWELDDFLQERETSTFPEPYKDGDLRQYHAFVRNQLEFEVRYR